MIKSKLKSNLLGIACTSVITAAPIMASAQLEAFPIGGLTGNLGSAGGLDGIGGLGDLTSIGGGLGGSADLTSGLDGLDQVSGLLADGNSAIGIAPPSFALGLFSGGLETLSALGVDALSGILDGGGLAGIPLLGGDIALFASPEGLTSGITALIADQRIPIAIPVVGPEPLKLYAPVVLAILDSQGLPVGDIPLPF